MWKPPQSDSPKNTSSAASQQSTPGVPDLHKHGLADETNIGQASINNGLFIKGEISGKAALVIDGNVEGSINLPGCCLTIGRNGVVAANIFAREVVVAGRIRGNVSATDRVNILSDGALTGDVSAARISIEDGAFFKGGIDVRKPDSIQAAQVEAEELQN